MRKYATILLLILFCFGCKKEEKKDIVYADTNTIGSTLRCDIYNEDLNNGYKMLEVQEFTSDENNKLEKVNYKIEITFLNNDAKIKLNSTIDNYTKMADTVNSNLNNLYNGMNMNVYYDGERFETSIYYDISLLTKDNLNNIEFKDYLNKNLTFDRDRYIKDQENNNGKCTVIYNDLT